MAPRSPAAAESASPRGRDSPPLAPAGASARGPPPPEPLASASASALRHTVVLARYGELSLKSTRVRARFEQRLVANLERALEAARVEGTVDRVPGRIYLRGPDLAALGAICSRAFGVVSHSPAVEVPAELATISRAAADYAEAFAPSEAASFAIRARRQGNHPFSSQDVAITAGQAVGNRLARLGRPHTVDLANPAFALHVEVRGKRAHLFHESAKAPGGLPLGTQGRLVGLLDVPESVVSCYLMMRRGADVHCIAFEDRMEEAERAFEALRLWNVKPYLKTWRWSDPPPEDPVARFRAMLAAGETHARRVKAQGIVTGETTRSEWVARLEELEGATTLPVYRPLVGLTRRHIDGYLERIRRGAP